MKLPNNDAKVSTIFILPTLHPLALISPKNAPRGDAVIGRTIPRAEPPYPVAIPFGLSLPCGPAVPLA